MYIQNNILTFVSLLKLNIMEKKEFVPKRGDIKTVREKLPEHLVNFVAIIKNNSEIRRFTSLAIINYLKQKEIITGKNNFVIFGWTKFTVKSDGLGIDYRYNEQFLIDSFVGSFSSFANNAAEIIDCFVKIENERLKSKEIENEPEVENEQEIETNSEK